jgi:FlaA1/EpsC-like NDP-sugar epimerase
VLNPDLPLRSVPDLERLDARALLGRAETAIDCSGAQAALGGRRILVTGAGGSVGVPLVQRLLRLGPAQLVLVDNHEDSLFRLQRRVREVFADGGAEAPATPAPALILADVRNRARLAAIFRTWHPEVVFHLAAYKHVHLGEAQPEEPVTVNVLGTHALVELAVAHEVEAFVYTSSDKAVNPAAVYGATKRLAELVVRRGATLAKGRFVIVRFVNVLGTRGSVIETFLEQLAARQPLTITDAAMERYWMSTREAVDLLLAAAARGERGSTLYVDPGDAIGVVEMAHRLSALLDAGTPQTLTIGTRAGERLAEELVGARERALPGPAEGLLAVRHVDGDAQLAAVPGMIAALTATVERDEPGLGTQLMALARELG